MIIIIGYSRVTYRVEGFRKSIEMITTANEVTNKCDTRFNV